MAGVGACPHSLSSALVTVVATSSLQALQQHVRDAEEALRGFEIADHAGEHYGPEGEYTAQSLKEGLRMALTALAALAERPERMLRNTTFQERQALLERLEAATQALARKDCAELARCLEELKLLVRPFDSHGSGNVEEAAQRIRDLNKEAEALLDHARSAMEWGAIAEISASFNSRYEELKQGRRWNLLWLLGAMSCLGATIWFSYETVQMQNYDLSFGFFFARFAMMVATGYGIWFCAFRFVRYQNTLEDYAYKVVLVKSMAAFLDRFEGQERAEYLHLVLSEIHQDPLRNKHDLKPPAEQIISRLRRTKPGA